MSGRDIENAKLQGKKKYGLVTRLHSHASGRLSGDQFCVYVANRLVIPSLKPEDLPKTSSTEFGGRAVVALACDPRILEKSRQFLGVDDLAREFGFTDTDGSIPKPLR